MRRSHLALLGAVVALGVLLYLLLDPGADRRKVRTDASHAETTRTTEVAELSTDSARANVEVRGRVIDMWGDPIQGAVVEAVTIAETRDYDLQYYLRGIWLPAPVVAAATSIADGGYALRVQAGSRVALRATAVGHAQEVTGARRMTRDVDGIDFRLVPGLGIAGRVVDDDGRPVPGAYILAYTGSLGERPDLPKLATRSDAEGKFSLTIRPPDYLRVVIRAAGYAPRALQDLQLPATNLLVTLDRGVALRLRVVEEEAPDRPIPGVRAAASHNGGVVFASTDEAGEARLETLPARPDESATEESFVLLWGDGLVGRRFALPRLDLPPGATHDIGDLALGRGGTVRGRVLDKETGKGVPGARVRAFGGLPDELRFDAAPVATSGPDGAYELSGVPLDAFQVVAYRAGYVSEHDPVFLAIFQLPTDENPLFQPGKRVATRDLFLLKGRRVEGVVLAPDGEPAVGAEVRLVHPESPGGRSLYGLLPTMILSGMEGRFEISGLAPGSSVVLRAHHPAFAPSTKVAVPRDAAHPVTLRLVAPLRLSGRVVNEEGDPFSGVRVKLTPERIDPSAPAGQPPSERASLVHPTVTDTRGRFVVHHAPRDDVFLVLAYPGRAPLERLLKLPDRKPAFDAGEIVLERGAGLAGRVVDELGRPLADVEVTATPASRTPRTGPRIPRTGPGRNRGEAKTDSHGRFAICGLKEGEYLIRGKLDGRFGEGVRVSTTAKDVELVLGLAGRLLGQVTSEGRPVFGASVSVYAASGPFPPRRLGWGLSDEDGNFEVNELPPGARVNVDVYHDAFKRLSRHDIRLSERRHEFALQPGLRIEGIVVRPDGTPVRGASVDVRSHRGGNKIAHTDEEGRFKVGGLPEGEFAVRLLPTSRGFLETEPVIVPAGSPGVRLVAVMGETISGTLAHADGSPAELTWVEAIDAEGKLAASDLCRRDGYFELLSLRPGVYTLRACLYSYGRDSGPGPGRRSKTELGELRDVRAGARNVRFTLPPR